MKSIKHLGKMISVFLSFILILILTLSLTLISAAQAINEKTIQTVISSVLRNDDVRAEISKEISTVATSAITDFIRQNAGNYDNADQTIQSWEEATPGYIDEILSTPEVQTFIGNIAADYAMAALSDDQTQPTVSLSSGLTDLIADNSDMFDKKFEKIFTDQNLSEEAAREKIVAFAAEQNITISENYDSYSDVILEIVKASEAQIDSSANDLFGNLLPASNAETSSNSISYQVEKIPYPMLAVQFSILGLDVNFHEDQSAFEIFTQILNILQNPVMYILLIAIFAAFFLLIILFTFSFRKPFLFTGISTIITGALLIVISKFPIPFDWISNQISTGNPAYDSAITEAIPGIWTSVSAILMVHAIIAIVIGVLFSLFFILNKKAKKENS